MTTQRQEPDLTPWDPIDEHPPVPGRVLEKLRLQAGLRRPDLARAAGYTNLSRGSGRVCQWERGDRRPTAEQCAGLDRGLGLPEGTVANLWTPLDQVENRHGQARVRVYHRDNALLREHHDLLRAHEQQILDDPAWANVRVDAARISLAWFGGGIFTVGELLKGWSDGSLRWKTTTGESALIYSANGSALSGLRRVGFIASPGASLDGRPHSLAFVHDLQRPRPPLSGLSLAQLLAELGVPVTDLVIRDHAGQPIARYDHAAHLLRSLDRRPLAAIGAVLGTDTTSRSSYCSGSIGSKRTDQPIAGIRPGGWSGYQLDLGEAFSYQPGRVVHDDRTVLWLDGAPPPALLPVLTELLGQEQTQPRTQGEP
ncbi:MAG: helix-turn-helix transcriptional regulator [Myxococcota bacterium]|jgi:transcriptional regulator with XRE-family HTH domain|nr:helix-turn-helix transcriptional regulator [Myxococcota bacterium]